MDVTKGKLWARRCRTLVDVATGEPVVGDPDEWWGEIELCNRLDLAETDGRFDLGDLIGEDDYPDALLAPWACSCGGTDCDLVSIDAFTNGDETIRERVERVSAALL